MNLQVSKALCTMAAVAAASHAVRPDALLASESSPGQITQVATDMNGNTPYVFISAGTRSTKPACATDAFWAIPNPTRDKAKAMFATILTAYTNKQIVYVYGSGNCDPENSTRETVNYILLMP